MKIWVSGKDQNFGAELAWAVYDPANFLVAASYCALPTAARAVFAALASGQNPRLVREDQTVVYLGARRGEYARAEQALGGGLVHTVVLHRSCLFREQHETPVVLALDGDLDRAVGRYLAARFGLPRVWEDGYSGLLSHTEWERLEVAVSPLYPQFKNLAAVRLSSRVDEERVLDLVGEALREGRLRVPRSPARGRFVPGWSLKQYLVENAPVLAEKLSSVRPRHVPGEDRLDPRIAGMKRIPFPAQAHMIQALVKALEEQKTAFCCGDMGTGKTLVALGTAWLLWKKRGRGFRVLIAAPPITVPKWRQEIEASVSGAVVHTVGSTEDALRLAREFNSRPPRGLEFVLVSTDRAKLGPEPWCAAVWKRVAGARHHAWHCPDCGAVLKKTVRDGYGRVLELELGWEDMARSAPPPAGHRGPKTPQGLPRGFSPAWRPDPVLRACPSCGAKLFRPALKSHGEARIRPRWFACRILRRLRFDLFIQDEVHQVKAQDSGRGDAFAQLVRSAGMNLALTGTLVNGLSTSIKEILWRTDPGALLSAGFDHNTGTVKWASRYGVLVRVTKVEEEKTCGGVVTRQKRTQLQPREAPGIAPQMTAEFLLHKAGFMELGDLGLPLVELKEIPVFVRLDPEHEEAYRRFHEAMKDACSAASQAGFKGAWSKFLPAVLNYADRPDLGAAVDVGGQLVTAPAFPPGYVTAKERALVDLVRKELAEGRGVIVYANYTDAYAVDERIRHVLSAHGIDASLLDGRVAPERRVAWLAGAAEKGTKVLVANMRLVEVGLDLLPWPTVVFYQLNYDVNTVRQAGRRAWRIGQDRECRVYYLVADGTQQVAQFERVMTKRGHAMMVEGRLDKSELARFARDEHTALAADLAECLASSDLADRWKELAARDMDANLVLVAEAGFKHAVAEAQKRLVAETLRLCGRQATVELVATGRPGLAEARVRLKVEDGGGRGRRAVARGQLAFDFFAGA